MMVRTVQKRVSEAFFHCPIYHSHRGHIQYAIYAELHLKHGCLPVYENDIVLIRDYTHASHII